VEVGHLVGALAARLIPPADVGRDLLAEAICDYVAFYPGRLDAAWAGDERVHAQDGDFYGGWITEDLVGPFKGAPGTLGW
jgi:hypothetical protein